MTVVAAFDFDRTLTSRDTVVPFLRRFTTVPGFLARSLPHSWSILAALVARDRDRFREIATDVVFRGRPVAEVDAEAAAHGSLIASQWLRPDTAARLRWHLEQGHRVVIVSASYDHYVDVVAARLGDVGVVATRLEVIDGACTGGLTGANCRGPEKLRRLEDWLRSAGLDRGSLTLYAYGDSNGDRELLAAADHPHWVGEPLATVAPSA